MFNLNKDIMSEFYYFLKLYYVYYRYTYYLPTPVQQKCHINLFGSPQK